MEEEKRFQEAKINQISKKEIEKKKKEIIVIWAENMGEQFLRNTQFQFCHKWSDTSTYLHGE